MNLKLDHQMFLVLNVVIGGLVAASLIGFALSRRAMSEDRKAAIDNLNAVRSVRNVIVRDSVFAD